MTVRWSLRYPSVKKVQVRVAGATLLLGCLLAGQVNGAAMDQYRLQARIDRLQAEESGSPELQFRAELLDAAASDPAVSALLDETRHRFEIRRQVLQQTQAELRERIDRSAASIDEQQQQLTVSQNRLALIRGKLKSLETAIEKGLIGQNYVDALLSEVAQLEALCSEMEAGIGQAKWSVAEYQLEQSRLELERRRIARSELEALTSEQDQRVPPESAPTGPVDHTPNPSSSSALQASQDLQTPLE